MAFIPNRCIASVITPVVKSNKNSVRDVNNYRPIALASTFSKLFELILLKYLESFLHTCDNQFGFKSGHGTDSCVFLLKQAEVESRTQGSRPRPRTQKNFEAKAKDRPSRGQGPRTQTQVFSKKKGSQNFFSGDLKKKVFKIFFQAIST